MGLIINNLRSYEARAQLENLIGESNFDEIGNLPGYRIFERRENPDLREVYDCLAFVSIFLRDKSLLGNIEKLEFQHLEFFQERNYENVSDLQNRDIISYGFRNPIKIPGMRNPKWKHMGVFMNGKVISKFGSFHVYEHDIKAIPNQYGDIYTTFRKRILF